MKKNEKEFKAVDFMRSARKRLTEKYLEDRTAFFKELEAATDDFIKSRKKKAASQAQ